MPNEEHRNGYATFESGDSGTSMDVVSVRDEATFQVNDITITYATDATAVATVELYDDAEGTGAGQVEGQFDAYQVNPGDSLVLSDLERADIDDDVVAVVNANDDNLTISVGGHLVTG